MCDSTGIIELTNSIIDSAISSIESCSIEPTTNVELKTKYQVTLEVSNIDGNINGLRLLKGKSTISDELLKNINSVFIQLLATPKIVEPSRVAVDIGNIGEEKVFTVLKNISTMNKDFNVYDTSSLKDHGDMCVEYRSKKICIEVKNYSNPVPYREIDKFHKSVSLPDYDCGIFIQLNKCGIAREAKISSPIDIHRHNSKLCFYLVDVNLDLLYSIITLLLDVVMIGEVDSSILDSKIKIISDINKLANGMNLEIEKTKKSVNRMEENLKSIIALSLVS